MLLLTKESPFVRFPPRRLPSLGAKAAPRKANSLCPGLLSIFDRGEEFAEASAIKRDAEH